MGKRRLGRAVRLQDDRISSIARVVGRLNPGDDPREASAHDRQRQCERRHQEPFRRARRARCRPRGRTDSRFGGRVEAEGEEQDEAPENLLQRRMQFLRELQPGRIGDCEFEHTHGSGYVDYYHIDQNGEGFI